MKSSGMEVNVISHKMQRYAVWYGGSLLGSLPDFQGACYSKADFDEYGPSIVVSNDERRRESVPRSRFPLTPSQRKFSVFGNVG